MKCNNFKQRIRKGFAAFMAGVAACSLFFPYGGGMSAVRAASPLESGELWLGDTKVTQDNCADILGDGTASYDPDTMTLTLNGVHIGADKAHIADKNGNVCDVTQIQKELEVYACSLYAKNTVTNLVINGYNTFELPKISRRIRETYSETYKYEWQIAEQFDVYYGIIIDNEGNKGTYTITGTGTIKSTVPEMDLEVSSFPDDKRYPIVGLTYMRGGTAFAWRGATGSVLYIGEEGAMEGPTFDLTSGVAALWLNLPATMYSGTIEAAVTRWDSYNSHGAPNCQVLSNQGSTGSNNNVLTLEGESFAHARIPLPNGVTSNDVNASLSDFTVESEWFSEDPHAIGGPEGIYCKWERGQELQRRKLGLDPTDEDRYKDVEIEVQGFTMDKTVYSVDVEWGAMTFQYEELVWDATAHTSTTGAGWKVYDSVAEKALDTTQDAINQIKVTNHSNADVYATLGYAAEQTDDRDYADTTGTFVPNAKDKETQFRQKTDIGPAYLTLGTANNFKGDELNQGEPTTGTVFFMPSGIKEEYKPTGDGITKWSQIGSITVGIKTNKPW